jgi:hypothetical protein
MKTAYETPKLSVHGSAEQITQAFGNQSLNDTVFFPDGRQFDAEGSRDGDVVPR